LLQQCRYTAEKSLAKGRFAVSQMDWAAPQRGRELLPQWVREPLNKLDSFNADQYRER